MQDLRGGGAEKALIELLKSFDYEKYKVTLCRLYYEGVYLDQIPAEVSVVTLYKRRNSFYRKSFRYYYKYHVTGLLAWGIRRKIRKHYDAIVSFMEGYSLLFHSFVTGRTEKNINWIHCDLYNFHYTKDFFDKPEAELAAYKKMDELVFVSNDAMSNFDKLYSVNVPKRRILNVIDVEKINRLAIGLPLPVADKLVVVAIGSLMAVKGFDRLIRVARMFKDLNYPLQFQIIGQGGGELELKALRDRLGLQQEVEFLGFKQPSYPYLKHADLLVSTSLSEGFPLVICEALALGIPVVATRTAGSVELLENGTYGLLTDHDDISIFEGIKELIDHPDLRTKYRGKSRERAKMFDVEQTMKQVYELF